MRVSYWKWKNIWFFTTFILSINKRKLKVRAIPENLPDFLTADISSLELGNKLLIDEIKSEDYTILHPDNTVLCKVRTSRASIEEVEEQADEEVTDESEEGAKEENKTEASEE